MFLNLKGLDYWMEMFNDLKSIWPMLLVLLFSSIINLWNQNALYQRENTEKFKTIINNISRFILVTLFALLYLLSMLSYSLNAYPKKEVIEYITNWGHIGSFLILLIFYSMLFPIVILPFLGKRRSKRFFIEIIDNQIIRREVIDRVNINNRDKLILKDADGFQTEKNITDIQNLKFETPYKKTWITMEDIKKFALHVRDKPKVIKVLICTIIFVIPTIYSFWTIKDIIGDLHHLQQSSDLFMYIGIFTLPAILITELYWIVGVIFYNIFRKN